MKVNGVQIPDEFNNGSIINNIVISKRGDKIAYINSKKELTILDMPKDGHLELEGTIIDYKNGSVSMKRGRSSINHMSVSGSSISISNGDVFINGNSELENKLSEQFTDVKKVVVKNSLENLQLAYVDNSSAITIEGKTREKPVLKNGILSLQNFKGTLTLPRTEHNLSLDIESSIGKVTGDIAHAGTIQTSIGKIELNLYSPLRVVPTTSIGKVKVIGLLGMGNYYQPPGMQHEGILTLNTSIGKIDVTYKLTDGKM